MSTTMGSAPARRPQRSARTPLARTGATALVLLLAAGIGAWQACGQEGGRTTDDRQAAAAPVRSSSAQQTSTMFSVSSEDEAAALLRTIHGHVSTRDAGELPAYLLVLGITLEDDAGGTGRVVKRLVLDLGDMSVRAIDLDTP